MNGGSGGAFALATKLLHPRPKAMGVEQQSAVFETGRNHNDPLHEHLHQVQPKTDDSNRLGASGIISVCNWNWLRSTGILRRSDPVVREGADSFVFQQNGDRFEPIAVHEKHRDQSFVIIENDGAIFPGDVVALRSAHQMQMAVKSKSGSAVDPHAGHNH